MSPPTQLHSTSPHIVGVESTSELRRLAIGLYGDPAALVDNGLLYRPASYHAMPRRPEVPGWIGEHPNSRPQHLNHIHFDIPRRHRRARPLDWAVAAVILAIRFLTRRPMEHIGHTAITLTVAAILTGIISIRTPILLAFWQWWLIALVLLIVGAAILGKLAREIAEAVGRHPAGSAVVNPTGTPEQIIAPWPDEVTAETARKRREFGTGLGR